MAEQLDTIEILGGKATIYRRVEGGSFHFFCRLKSEGKRFRQSLKTVNAVEATSKAEDLVVEILAKQRQGLKVLSSSVGEVIDIWHAHQTKRFERGERRYLKNITDQRNWMVKQLGAVYGLDTPISDITQSRFDDYLPFRSKTGVKLSTVVDEMKAIRAWIRDYGMKHGASVVPVLEVKVPSTEKSRRTDTFTKEEYVSLVKTLNEYIKPDQDGEYVRKVSLSNRIRRPHPCHIDQGLEEARRLQTRWLTLILASSGCRPHEVIGSAEASLRWRDVEFKEMKVSVQLSQKVKTKKEICLLSVRDKTKTNRRLVPCVASRYLKELKEWSKFTEPDDLVFTEQVGRSKGNPVYTPNLRCHFNWVLERMGFDRFKGANLYSLRHFWITQRLSAGVPPYLVAQAAGNSVDEIERTYSHLLLHEEGIVKQIWKESTPPELAEINLPVLDEMELVI